MLISNLNSRSDPNFLTGELHAMVIVTTVYLRLLVLKIIMMRKMKTCFHMIAQLISIQTTVRNVSITLTKESLKETKHEQLSSNIDRHAFEAIEVKHNSMKGK